MKKRIISAVVLLMILIPLIIIGSWPFRLAVGIVGFLSYKEICNLYDYPLSVKILGFIALMIIIYGNISPDYNIDFKVISLAALLIYLPIIIYQVKGKYTMDDAFKFFGFIFIVGISLYTIILVRNINLTYFLFMVLTPIFTDTFAYVGGMLIGKHKVTQLSKKKSLEGYITGSVMGTFMMFMYYITFIGNNINMLLLILVILLLTVVAQLGDLVFSAIKRQYNIKDFSNLIPGHGGVLDRIDSQIFVAITFMIFIKFIIGG